MSPSEPKTREGAQTKARILRAAQKLFATRGYADSSLRDITAAADVNLALVSRYFGSKENLFAAALADALNADQITAIPRAQFGKRLVQGFVDGAAGRPNPLPMLMLATGDGAARRIALALLRRRVLAPLKSWFAGKDAEERAARLLAVTAGFFMYRIVYPLAPFQGALPRATRAWLERTLQAIIDEP